MKAKTRLHDGRLPLSSRHKTPNFQGRSQKTRRVLQHLPSAVEDVIYSMKSATCKRELTFTTSTSTLGATVLATTLCGKRTAMPHADRMNCTRSFNASIAKNLSVHVVDSRGECARLPRRHMSCGRLRGAAVHHCCCLDPSAACPSHSVADFVIVKICLWLTRVPHREEYFSWTRISLFVGICWELFFVVDRVFAIVFLIRSSSFEVAHAVQLFASCCTAMLCGGPLIQCCQVRPTSGPGQARSGDVCSNPARIKTTKQHVSEVQRNTLSERAGSITRTQHFWWCIAVREVR